MSEKPKPIHIGRIRLDIKPTNHYCICTSCKREISKGSHRLSVLGSRRPPVVASYFHPACFIDLLVQALKDLGYDRVKYVAEQILG